ncbi:MAG TPA: hypothetical protein VHC49_14515 [Mycobacteriales bacterium]|nr:hypothetical protein [Mycobacteriales bacterium]
MTSPRRSVIPLPENGIRATQCGGNTVGGVLRERAPRADGYRHLDTPAMIAKLKELNANTYIYGIWDTPVDWDDLGAEFAPAAAAAGIDIWVYLVPPTETAHSDFGRASRPFRMDYLAWARAIGELSAKYPNLTAWGIDDFEFNQELFTPEYVGQMRTISQELNPQLGLFLCTYFHAATDDAFMAKYGPLLDAVLYPFLDGHNNNTQVASSVGADLDEIKRHTDRHDLDLILLVYTGRFLDASLEPTEDYAAEAVRIGLEYTAAGKIAGVTAYGLQLDDLPTISSSNRAMYGNGRLSLAVANFAETTTGAYSEAAQTVAVDPGSPRYEISFWHFDTFTSRYGGKGRHIKQFLIDGEVVWSEDVDAHSFALWQQCSTLDGPIDVTPHLRGKTSARIAFRLLEQEGGRGFPIDVGIDNIETIGFTVVNPGFESRAGWELSQDFGTPYAAIDIYSPQRPRLIFEAVSREYER